MLLSGGLRALSDSDERVVRRLCAKYAFEKPNDRRALELMNAAATGLMAELPDIILAYGISDEFRYVPQLHPGEILPSGDGFQLCPRPCL